MKKSSEGSSVSIGVVDPGGRLERVAESLRETRIESVERVSSVEDVSPASDCVVVLDAPANDRHEDVDGLRLLREAEEQYEAPVVVYSFREGSDSRQPDALVDGGAADVIRVPPNREQLLASRIRHVCSDTDSFQPPADQFSSLLNNYPHTLFIKDEHGRFENVSSHTAGNYGFTREQMIGMTDYELFESDLADQLWEEEQEIMRTGRPELNKIEEYVDENGKRRWVSTTKVPRYDEDGSIVGIVGGNRDVTAAKRQEAMMAALHEASRELSRVSTKSEISRVATDIAVDVSLFADVEVVLQRNGELHRTSKEITDERATFFAEHREAFETALETGQTQYVDAQGTVTGDRSLVEEAELIGRPLDEKVGMVVPLGTHGVMSLGLDEGMIDDFTNRLAHVLASNVTAALDRADRERELEQKNRQLEEFATIGAHELRNRLQIALSSVARERAERDTERLQTTEQTLERMNRLLNQVLQLARTGRIPRTKIPVDLAETVETAWSEVETDTLELGSVESAVLKANEDALVELFTLLFRNAAEHAGDGVVVTVGTLDDGFFVEDDGVGIPEERKGTLFDVEYTDTTDDAGYGLHIVSAIVEAHDWSVDVKDGTDGGVRYEITGVELESLH